ncbi:unnamed protein product [Mesocestoides corti]|uniref:Heat shock 70 kDa protein 14 n=1 Tax=Mesocestoides corti TaxID=53468 RepID=A0A0R3UIA9_MESCO|nr:unnamed protein product [Mesocestoides corti]
MSTPPPKSTGAAIGIDFGTTKCSSAHYRDGRISLHRNEHQKTATPVYLTFDLHDEIKHGEMVRNHFELSVNQTLFGIKRLIHPGGPSINNSFDRNVQMRMGMCEINGVENASPVKICSHFISYLKSNAEKDLREKVTSAVITVPFVFTHDERETIKEAAKSAGLENVLLVHETTAAALAYATDNQISQADNVLVVSFGGGYMEAKYFSHLSQHFLEAYRNMGDPDCFGEELTQLIIDHLNKRCHQQTGCNLLAKPKMQHLVRLEAERIKRSLTTSPSMHFEFTEVGPGIDFKGVFTTGYLNALSAKMISGVRETLKAASMDWKYQVKEIVVTGGSSRLGCVKKLLREIFPRAALRESINAEEAAVYGAGVLAHFWKTGQLEMAESQEQTQVNIESSQTTTTCSSQINNSAHNLNLQTETQSPDNSTEGREPMDCSDGAGTERIPASSHEQLQNSGLTDTTQPTTQEQSSTATDAPTLTDTSLTTPLQTHPVYQPGNQIAEHNHSSTNPNIEPRHSTI